MFSVCIIYLLMKSRNNLIWWDIFDSRVVPSESMQQHHASCVISQGTRNPKTACTVTTLPWALNTGFLTLSASRNDFTTFYLSSHDQDLERSQLLLISTPRLTDIPAISMITLRE
jgi:hypothetical protein